MEKKKAPARGWQLHSKPSEQAHRTTRYNGQDEESTCRWRYENSSPPRVVFSMEQPDWTATLATRWDPATSQCRLVVTRSFDAENEKIEFPHAELWKAVQYILEPFFFPDDG